MIVKIKVTNSDTGEIIEGSKYSVSKYLQQEGYKITDECIQVEKMNDDRFKDC